MPSPSYERLQTQGNGVEDAQDALEEAHDPLNRRHPGSLLRPHVYYGDGPFDPPSSDSEEEHLLEKGRTSPGTAERGLLGVEDAAGLTVGGKRRPTSLQCLIISLCALVLMAAMIGTIAAWSYSGTSYSHVPGSKHITMDHIFNGTFFVSKRGIRWVPEAGDGVFSIGKDGKIQLVDLKTNTTSDLVSLRDIKNDDGMPLGIADWSLSADMKYMLLKTDYVKQWRHSSFGNYYVHDIEGQTTHHLIPPSHPPVTAYAAWSPTGQSIAYVASNDLYILPTPDIDAKSIRITTSGNSSLFHGVPDWVYEEEVFSKDYALWWSPDSTKLAFLRLDETLVDEYKFPVYNPTEDSSAVFPYTGEIAMKYPKPGYNNPLVSAHVFDLERYLARQRTGDVLGFPIEDATRTLDWDGRQAQNDSVITEVAWVGNDTLIVREVNRAADDGSVVLFDLAQTGGGSEGRVVRKLGKNGEHKDDGWIESNQYIYPIPAELTGGVPAYLDIVNNSAGYNHIALFSPADSGTPVFVTSGEWEVTDGILGIDAKRGWIYFTAGNPSSIERNLFSVPIPAAGTSAVVEPSALTDVSRSSYFEAQFSPQAGFYLLSYRGPSVPWQSIFRVGSEDFEYPVTNNARLNETSSQFQEPLIIRSTIQSDGYDLNVMELRPPNFDDTGRTKYPVLFRVYGGPGSQMVHTQFERDWHHYLACSLKYVIVTVDGRGTGFKGRSLRNPVRANLGYWEVQDQINTARIWASKAYVDPKKIGIWGWSYGGFMSSKVIEADAGIHTLAMAVAPVTSWRLYDSIYTERYMTLPATNPSGYTNASISNVTAFHNVDFLLAHGSGDDNVHFANSAHLLDMFTRAQVRNFRFRMFTDSDHGISRRGAYREVHEFMLSFLLEKWGKGGTRRGW